MPSGNGYQIEDLQSANGILVNGVKVLGTQALSPGDVISVGPQSLAFEVASATKVVEVGSAERAKMPPPLAEFPRARSMSDSDPLGCAPSFDLDSLFGDMQGCLNQIIRILPYLLLLLVLAFLFMLIVSGVGGLLGALGGAGAAAGGGGTHGGSAGGGGSASPPPVPPQNQDQGTIPIRILSTRLVHEGGKTLLHVDWRNDSETPVFELKAKVKALDAAGVPMYEAKSVTVYSGEVVLPHEEHHETENDPGAPLGLGSGAAVKAIVTPTEVR